MFDLQTLTSCFTGSEEFKVPVSPVTTSPSPPMEEVTAPPAASLPAVDEALDKLSPTKEPLDCSVDSDSNELLGDIHVLDENDSTGGESSVKEAPKTVSTMEVVQSLTSRLTTETLASLPSHQLVSIHQELATMMGNVMNALKAKCPSPTPSAQ